MADAIGLRDLPLRILLRGAGAGLACGEALLRVMPEEKVTWLAPHFGHALRWAQKRRVLAHLKQFLRRDDWTTERWDQLWRAHLTHIGHTLREACYWSHLPRQEVLDRVTLEGQEHIHEALRAGRGAMVFINHLGNFLSIAPAFWRAGWKGCVVRNALPMVWLDRRVQDWCTQFGGGQQFIGGGVPAMAARTFRQNTLLFLAVDFSEPDERNVWIPFGPVETRVSLGPALLALRHRVPVLCVTCERLDAMRHRVVVHPPLVRPRTGHAHADARVLTREALRLVTEDVRRHPEQWWPWDWVPLRGDHSTRS